MSYCLLLNSVVLDGNAVLADDNNVNNIKDRLSSIDSGIFDEVNDAPVTTETMIDDTIIPGLVTEELKDAIIPSDDSGEEPEDEISILKKEVNNKEIIRSELQQLLKEEEKIMVALTENVENTNIVNNESKLKENVNNATDCAEEDDINENGHTTNGNGHHALGVLDFEDNGEVEVTFEQNTIVEQSQTLREDQTSETKEANDEQTLEVPELKEEAVHAESVVVTPRRSTREKKSTHSTATATVVEKKQTKAQIFQDLNLKMTLLEGHHHDICAIDMEGKYVVSGGRDTSLKLWDASSNEEVKSFGGHEGTVTSLAFMKDKPYTTYPSVITASYDCSIRIWDMDKGGMTKSIYVYSPVTCLDYSAGLAAIGTEGGKVELFNLESGEQVYTVNAYETPVTTVKIMGEDKVVSGSHDGVVKIFDYTKANEKIPLFTLDPEVIRVKSTNEVANEPANVSTKATFNMTKINCMTLSNELIIYGDSGYNIKVLDYKKGELTKVRNNLNEYCPTEALHIANVQGQSFLFSVGSDVDNGDSYMNIRSLPDFEYHGTIRDIFNNSGSITSFALQEVDKHICFVTGGGQLRVWKQVVRRGRKRKGSPNEPSLIPCK